MAGTSPRQAQYRAWMLGDALPVWSEVGRDAPGLGFHESLRWDGTPAEVPFKRMRVQARQIYVFSHAHVLGGAPGMEAAADAHRFITAHGSRADGAWARVLGRDGGVLDPAADLYDIAFVLLALAWFARASGEAAPLHQARRTLQWLRAHMALPQGGYCNTLPTASGHRQQNPHMHLLEAALALYETSQEACFAELAQEMVGLFRRYFHDAASGTLGEFYDERLRPAPGADGDHVEPGHHYEWVWLLDRYVHLFGGPALPEADSLFAFAETHGWDLARTAVLDVVGRDGRVRKASTRLWPQTEAVRAYAMMHARGRPMSDRIESVLATVLDRHLAECPRGTWRDHFAAVDGAKVLSAGIPASSLYHLFTAYAALPAGTQAREI